MSVVVLCTTTRFQTNAKEKLSIQNVSNNNVPNFHDFNWKLCKVLYHKSNFHDNQINFFN
jgi:hypothetical protein